MRNRKQRIILFLITLAGFVVLLILLKPKVKTSPLPQSLPKKTASFQSIIPGSTTEKQVLEKLGKPINNPSADVLKYQSNNPNLPHEIIFDNEKVSFIKEIVSPDDQKTTDEIKEKYGLAPYVLYGPDAIHGFNLYVYPNKGLAYLGHFKEPILLEIWYFSPTSFEDFQKKFAPQYSQTYTPRQ